LQLATYDRPWGGGEEFHGINFDSKRLYWFTYCIKVQVSEIKGEVFITLVSHLHMSGHWLDRYKPLNFFSDWYLAGILSQIVKCVRVCMHLACLSNWKCGWEILAMFLLSIWKYIRLSVLTAFLSYSLCLHWMFDRLMF
jgi:hypothetical protein